MPAIDAANREREGDDAVFKALAEPHRRTLLDALFVGDGQTLGELCAAVPALTRFGVMKHLSVLEQAELVTMRREGRRKLHYLNPVPIQALQRRWIAKYAEPLAAGLVAVRDQFDGPDPPQEEPWPHRATSTARTSGPRRSRSGRP